MSYNLPHIETPTEVVKRLRSQGVSQEDVRELLATADNPDNWHWLADIAAML